MITMLVYAAFMPRWLFTRAAAAARRRAAMLRCCFVAAAQEFYDATIARWRLILLTASVGGAMRYDAAAFHRLCRRR